MLRLVVTEACFSNDEMPRRLEVFFFWRTQQGLTANEDRASSFSSQTMNGPAPSGARSRFLLPACDVWPEFLESVVANFAQIRKPHPFQSEFRPPVLRRIV